jgi:hypothetical protein
MYRSGNGELRLRLVQGNGRLCNDWPIHDEYERRRLIYIIKSSFTIRLSYIIDLGGRGRLSSTTAAIFLLIIILVASKAIELVPMASLVRFPLLSRLYYSYTPK